MREQNCEHCRRFWKLLNFLLVVFIIPGLFSSSNWHKNLHRRKSCSCRGGQRGRWGDWHPTLWPVFPGKDCRLKERRTSSVMRTGARLQGAGKDWKRTLMLEALQTWTSCWHCVAGLAPGQQWVRTEQVLGSRPGTVTLRTDGQQDSSAGEGWPWVGVLVLTAGIIPSFSFLRCVMFVHLIYNCYCKLTMCRHCCRPGGINDKETKGEHSAFCGTLF